MNRVVDVFDPLRGTLLLAGDPRRQVTAQEENHDQHDPDCGVVHELPADLAEALALDPVTAELWRGLTPLGRSEFVCWVEDTQKPETRQRRIRRTEEEMHEGKRRPCCWPGCKHRGRTGR